MMVGFRDEHGVAERGRQKCEWRQGHWATEWHPDSLYDPAGGVGSVRFCSQRASEFKGREQWTPPLAGGCGNVREEHVAGRTAVPGFGKHSSTVQA